MNREIGSKNKMEVCRAKRKFFYLITTLMSVAVLVTGCKQTGEDPPEQEAEVRQHRQVEFTDPGTGLHFLVKATATAHVDQDILDYLIRNLRIEAVQANPNDTTLIFWQEPEGFLDDQHPEIKLNVSAADPDQQQTFIYFWPEIFTAVMPGVLRLLPGVEGQVLANDNEVGATAMNLDEGDFTRIQGTLMCSFTDAEGDHRFPLRNVALFVDGEVLTTTANNGRFAIDGSFADPGTLDIVVRFMSFITHAASGSRTMLIIMDDIHNSRNIRVPATTTVMEDILDLGEIDVRHSDCDLWNRGVGLLDSYHNLLGASPPAGMLRFKRWSAIFSGTPHAYYDYIVLNTNYVTSTTPDQRDQTLNHEFGHSIRHVADGPEHHWTWDNFRFAYARIHNIDQISSEQFAFNEGWANYYRQQAGHATRLPNLGAPLGFSTPPGNLDPFIDWNQSLIGHHLAAMANAVTTDPVPTRMMVTVLITNPGAIHTLSEFEDFYCRVEPDSNPFCGSSRRADTGPCPPGYNNDGATCRLLDVRFKPSYGRGVGRLPSRCPAGQEYDAGLCYPVCRAGFHGLGPMCWEDCRRGYTDDGLTCRRDLHLIASDNSACPWFDFCGVTLARGCSTCPPGFQNDGCTCRIDVDIYGKNSYGRGVGQMPIGCGPGLELVDGLCYPQCAAGFNGVGPVCWGSCPAGYRDDGWTCWHEPHIFTRF